MNERGCVRVGVCGGNGGGDGARAESEGCGRNGGSMPLWYRPPIRPASLLHPAALNTDFDEGERSLSHSSVLCVI